MSNLREIAAPAPRATPASGIPSRGMSPLARDVIVVLVVKAIVLYGLWYAFFRMPAAPGMTMDPAVVEHRLFAPTSLVEPPNEP